jgi:hypothetical protein
MTGQKRPGVNMHFTEKLLVRPGSHGRFAYVKKITRSVGTAILFIAVSNPQSANAQPAEAGYRDFYYGTTVTSTPTGEKPESKLWWNDGIWWGCLWDPALSQYAVHRLDTATQTWASTGTVIDPRPKSKADALWDGQFLYVASHIFTSNGNPTSSANAARLYRFRYDAATKSYSPDAGFPVNINSSTSETLVLAKDSTGKLWITWVESGKVKVNRSTGGDLNWGAPFDLPVQGSDVGADDISSIVAFGSKAVAGSDKIGMIWSNQLDLGIYFVVHLDGDDDTVWQSREAVLSDSDLGAIADDHINVKTSCDDSGNLYAVTKTSLIKSDEPLIFMLKRDANGVWTRHLYGKVSDGHTRPILLIDSENNKIYVFAKSDKSGAGVIYVKSSDLSDISFAPGLGTRFIQSASDADINDLTSTKQCLNGVTDLVVLASDAGSRYYLHNHLDLASRYAMTVKTVGPGQVTLNPPNGVYPAGTPVTLTATPATGYVFRRWSGDLSGANNPATITMDADKDVTAIFTVPVAYAQTKVGGSSNSMTVTTSASLNGVNGHLYLAAISATPNAAVNNVSGLGLKWTRVKTQCAGRNHAGVEVWMAQGTPSSNGTVTATFASAPYHAGIAVSGYYNVDAATPLGNVVSGNTNGVDGACDGGVDNAAYAFDLITTANGAMVFGAAAMRNRTHTPGANYTERAEFMQCGNDSAAAIVVQDQSLASAATVTVNGTFSDSVDWAVIAVEIMPPGEIPTPLSVSEKQPRASFSAGYRLEQNYPNPFNPTTHILYSLPKASHVRLAVFDINGRTVAILADGFRSAGAHAQVWESVDANGRPLASGVYLCRLEADSFAQMRRMALVR